MDIESQTQVRPLLGEPSEPKYVYAAESSVRSGFIRKVYGILALQLVLTTAIGGFIATQSIQWIFAHQSILSIVGILGSFGTLIPLVCVPSLGQKRPWNMVLLGLFTASEGILLGLVCGLYALDSVLIATALTAGVFVVLSLVAMTIKVDLTSLMPYLIGLTLILILLGLFTVFLPQYRSLQVMYGGAAAALFSVYIVVDTQMITSNNVDRKFLVDDYVFAAIAIYLDIVNLFLAILQLIGKPRRE